MFRHANLFSTPNINEAEVLGYGEIDSIAKWLDALPKTGRSARERGHACFSNLSSLPIWESGGP
jgi:hypothetical protein